MSGAPEKDRPMKILALTAENVKRLTAVHIEPNGNHDNIPF